MALTWTSGKGEKGDQGIQGIQGIQGNDGFSPEASVMPTATGARVTIKDKNGITTADINNGQNGSKGDSGFSPTATVTQTQTGATVSITDANGTTTAEIHNGTNGSNGNDGAKGADGVSPVATVSQLPNGAQISITDANGTTTATISNGTNGSDGQAGADGFSPTASVTPTASGATIEITDKNGTTSANISNGQAGANGNDGVSPSATIQQTATGAVIEITDAVGTTTATISNGTPGAKGDPGVGIPSGGSDGQVLAKDGATDYATKWINPPQGGGGGINKGELVGNFHTITIDDVRQKLVPLIGECIWIEKYTEQGQSEINIIDGRTLKTLILTNSVSRSDNNTVVQFPWYPSIWRVTGDPSSYIRLLRVDCPQDQNSSNVEPVQIVMTIPALVGTVYPNHQVCAFNDAQTEIPYGYAYMKSYAQIPAALNFGGSIYKCE